MPLSNSHLAAPINDGTSAVSADPSDYLASSYYVDHDSAAVRDFVARHVPVDGTVQQRAIALFYAVRDKIRYNAYAASLDARDYRASKTIESAEGWCVPKGVVMTACARAIGIPARPGYADVRNHLSTQNLLDMLGTDIFAYHGYVELWINDAWVKATPVFNIELCEKFGVAAQEFDGSADCLFQEFDQAGRRHMEYLRDRGAYTDLPLTEILADFAARYPKWIEAIREGMRGDLMSEAAEHGSG